MINYLLDNRLLDVEQYGSDFEKAFDKVSHKG